jgi:hypothetical protein
MEVINCPHCKVVLFVDRTRPPKCGSCGGELRLSRFSLTGWLGRLLKRPEKGRKPKIQQQTAPKQPPLPRAIASNIKEKIDRLVSAAWGNTDDIKRHALLLNPQTLRGLRDEEAIGAMLRHARKMAPRMNVPMMTPRVSVEAMPMAAGTFTEQDGWVKVAVDNKFFDDRAAAHAILAHELCHYVLFASGIREQVTLENERLTDAAMFVLGLGEVFLAGYQREAQTTYRPGHRLGYLTDEEYQYAAAYVSALRSSPDKFVSKETEARRRFQAVVRDADTRERLLAIERKKHPGKSEIELIEYALEALARDNR